MKQKIAYYNSRSSNSLDGIFKVKIAFSQRKSKVCKETLIGFEKERKENSNTSFNKHE